jgi:hypothetical protein
MKVTVEIGKELAGVMKTFLNNYKYMSEHRHMVNPGEAFKKAFGLELSKVAIHLGSYEQALKKGVNVTIKTTYSGG